MQFTTLLIGASALLAPVFAQTFTDCDPTKKTCPNDPALGISTNFVFNTSQAVTNSFNITAGALSYGTNGAEFTINKQKDSPTIQSHFYIFFGSVSVIMKAASGQGIISSIVLESDDLDEVDWEFMGGNTTFAETNYFGKGNQTTFDRAIYYPVSSNVQENFHNYTVDWTSERLIWLIDSVPVRTLHYADAVNGTNYPQTPMTVRMGIWSGGDVDNNNNGTVEWAGGPTDFSKAPFSMYVQSVHVADYSTGKEYQYTDRTGSFASIKAIQGNSTAATTIAKAAAEANEPPKKSLAQKFQDLPKTTKLAIYAGAGGAGALLLALLTFTCIRQRRAGRRERDAYNAAIEKAQNDAYREQLELREKGLGGFDPNSTQGEDALGGWGGTHAVPGENGVPTLPKMPGGVFVNEVPSRTNSPAAPERMASPGFARVNSPGAPERMGSPAISRINSPAPLMSPTAQHSPTWNGGNQGGMIHNAQNSYSGGYGGNPNIPRSPSFPLNQPGPPQRSFTGGFSQHGGYQRF